MCGEYDYSCGKEHEMDDYTYSLTDALEIKNIDKYAYGSLNQPMDKNIL